MLLAEHIGVAAAVIETFVFWLGFLHYVITKYAMYPNK